MWFWGRPTVVNWETIKIRTCFLAHTQTLLGNWPQGFTPLFEVSCLPMFALPWLLVTFICDLNSQSWFIFKHERCAWENAKFCQDFDLLCDRGKSQYAWISGIFAPTIESVTWYVSGNSKQGMPSWHTHTCSRFHFRPRENLTWECQRRFCILECANIWEKLSNFILAAKSMYTTKMLKNIYWCLKHMDFSG